MLFRSFLHRAGGPAIRNPFQMQQKSRFISIEIVIKTDHDCDAFVEWFHARDNHVEKMPCETHRWYIYFAPIPSSSADSTVQMLCKMIAELPDNIMKQWNQAGYREFVAGYHVEMDAPVFMDHFSPKTLTLVAQVGATIGIALYPLPAGANCPQVTNSEDNQ